MAIDRDGIGQSQLVAYNSSIFCLPWAEHSTTWLPAWRSQGLLSDREKLGQSAIGIALYQGPMDTFLDPTNYNIYIHIYIYIYIYIYILV